MEKIHDEQQQQLELPAGKTGLSPGGMQQLELPAERTQGDSGAPLQEGCSGAPLSKKCARPASGGMQQIEVLQPPTAIETNEDEKVVDGWRQTRLTDYFKSRPKREAEKHPDDIDQVENAAVLCACVTRFLKLKMMLKNNLQNMETMKQSFR